MFDSNMAIFQCIVAVTSANSKHDGANFGRTVVSRASPLLPGSNGCQRKESGEQGTVVGEKERKMSTAGAVAA